MKIVEYTEIQHITNDNLWTIHEFWYLYFVYLHILAEKLKIFYASKFDYDLKIEIWKVLKYFSNKYFLWIEKE